MQKLFVTKLEYPHARTEHCESACCGIYLASDVEAYASGMDQIVTAKDARIAELERDIAEKTGLITTLQRANDRLRQKIDRLSK